MNWKHFLNMLIVLAVLVVCWLGLIALFCEPKTEEYTITGGEASTVWTTTWNIPKASFIGLAITIPEPNDTTTVLELQHSLEIKPNIDLEFTFGNVTKQITFEELFRLMGFEDD